MGGGTHCPAYLDVSTEQLLSEIWVGTRGGFLQGPARILGQETRGGGVGAGCLEVPCTYYSMEITACVRACLV